MDIECNRYAQYRYAQRMRNALKCGSALTPAVRTIGLNLPHRDWRGSV